MYGIDDAGPLPSLYSKYYRAQWLFMPYFWQTCISTVVVVKKEGETESKIYGIDGAGLGHPYIPSTTVLGDNVAVIKFHWHK